MTLSGINLINLHWTDEMVGLLKSHLEQGLSQSQSGRLLQQAYPDLTFTRSMISGKRKRLGLKLGHNNSHIRKRKPAKLLRAFAPLRRPNIPPVSLWEVVENQCRWIVEGEGYNAMFCGAPRYTAGLQPHCWCKYHRMIGTRKPDGQGQSSQSYGRVQARTAAQRQQNGSQGPGSKASRSDSLERSWQEQSFEIANEAVEQGINLGA